MSSVRERHGEAFWRAHHDAWLQSEFNQREYCEAYGIPLKAFGNWRARFKAEPQPPARKVLYRRGVVSHALSHSLSHRLSHDLPVPGPIVRPAREGRRRRSSEADKRQILEEAMRPDARFSEVARRYGIAERVLFRWKQELTQVAPLFVAVEIADAPPDISISWTWPRQTSGCALPCFAIKTRCRHPSDEQRVASWRQ
jgi:transposase-like protein